MTLTLNHADQFNVNPSDKPQWQFSGLDSEPTAKLGKSSSTGNEQLEKEFDETAQGFYKMLFANLKHQLPDDAYDADQITQTYGVLTQTQQSFEVNKTLNQLLANTEKSELARASEFVGQEVEYDGSTKTLIGDSGLQFSYTLNYDDRVVDNTQRISTKIAIKDYQGRVVYRADGKKTKGQHIFNWNGKDDKGKPLAQGCKYTMSAEATYEISNGEKSQRLSLEINTNDKGIVTEVRSVNGRATLLVNGLQIDVDAVRALRNKVPATSTNDIVGYIGKEVEIRQDRLEIIGGVAEIAYRHDIENFGRVRFHIKDQQGNIVAVAEQTEGVIKGENKYQWYGKAAQSFGELEAAKKNGTKLPKLADGNYTYEVLVEDKTTSQFVPVSNNFSTLVQEVKRSADGELMIVDDDGNSYYTAELVAIKEPVKAATSLAQQGAEYVGTVVEYRDNRFNLGSKGGDIYFELPMPDENTYYHSAKIEVLGPNGGVIAVLTVPAQDFHIEGEVAAPKYAELSRS